ncbi:hypothetical protein HaLaN_13907 [Haematococcus lacustris]|uniref:Uncharacterized protein n=1 Tax=Haematococcus lacustris TaxID=44745 RepID=A0A699Z5D3_HAELA|nr:hypothetical protein HaLaN_13907 [Haematococcus lacustris]
MREGCCVAAARMLGGGLNSNRRGRRGSPAASHGPHRHAPQPACVTKAEAKVKHNQHHWQTQEQRC